MLVLTKKDQAIIQKQLAYRLGKQNKEEVTEVRAELVFEKDQTKRSSNKLATLPEVLYLIKDLKVMLLQDLNTNGKHFFKDEIVRIRNVQIKKPFKQSTVEIYDQKGQTAYITPIEEKNKDGDFIYQFPLNTAHVIVRHQILEKRIQTNKLVCVFDDYKARGNNDPFYEGLTYSALCRYPFKNISFFPYIDKKRKISRRG
jgi:hypothetical protein